MKHTSPSSRPETPLVVLGLETHCVRLARQADDSLRHRDADDSSDLADEETLMRLIDSLLTRSHPETPCPPAGRANG